MSKGALFCDITQGVASDKGQSMLRARTVLTFPSPAEVLYTCIITIGMMQIKQFPLKLNSLERQF